MPPPAAGLSLDPVAVAPPSAATCAAVVVHYRDAGPTLLCLVSLLRQDHDLEVVVVDNGSPDGSGQELQRSLAGRPGVHLLHADRNGGFGAGCNLGFEFAMARWPGLQHVLLLNPDAEMEAGALGEMSATSRRHPQAGIVGCRIEDGDGRISFANGRAPTWTLSGFHCAPPPVAEHASEFVTGACMLIAADLLRDGLRFCETFFLYCEDVDLCCEVRARGRELWVTQGARVRHRGGGSQPGRPVLGELTAERLFWLTRGKVILARRRLSWLQRLGFLFAACLGKPLVGLATTRSARFLVPYFSGLLAGIRTDPGAARKPGGSPSTRMPS